VRNAEFEARWVAWAGRGRQHALAVRRKARAALVSAAFVSMVVALFSRITAGVW